MRLPEWKWSTMSPDRPGVSAEQKVFKQQDIVQSGDLQVDSPNNAATIFVREVVQNSVDAGDELRRELRQAGGRRKKIPDLEVRFQFKTLKGEDKQSLVEGLDLINYVARIESVGRDNLEFPDREWLEDLEQPTNPLNILIVSERGTRGMAEAWNENCDSKMFKALFGSALSDKPAGAAGSFGYGKAGLVNGATGKLVFAYSCFKESEDDDNVTRRAIAGCYWRPHTADGRQHDGWGRLGKLRRNGEGIEPLTDADADRMAERLGISARTVGHPGFEGTGTVFVLIDPAITPKDVQLAAERNWWPALENDSAQLHLSVVDYDGSELRVDPRRHEVLKDLIDTFNLAREAESVTQPVVDREGDDIEYEFVRKFTKYGNDELGRLAMKATREPDSWSWVKPTNPGHERCSIVALVRNSGMVVEHRVSGGSRLSGQLPFVRGVFIADPEVNDYLRDTEPPLHSRWKQSADANEIHIPAKVTAYEIAKTIQSRIDRDVRKFRDQLKEPAVDTDEPVTLPIVARALAGKSGRRPPPPGPDLTEKRSQKHTFEEVPTNDQLMLMQSRYELGLQNTAPFETGRASVKFVYHILEDDVVGKDSCKLHIDPPEGFTRVETPTRKADLIGADGRTVVDVMPKYYEYEGTVTKEQSVTFTVRTDPYHKDWTVKAELVYKVVEATEAEARAAETNG